MPIRQTLTTCLALFAFICLNAQELYQLPADKHTRWISFENHQGTKAGGGLENKGAKGHAFDVIEPGQTVELVDYEGSGTIRRIWLTLSDRSPEMMRSLRIEMYWDNSVRPAVSAPLGDFFGVGLGQRVAFESALFSDPEGRSYNCIVPMPFRENARVVITNDSESQGTTLFYEVDLLLEEHGDDMMYFHTYWNRDARTALREDFRILPKIEGAGRFLGTNIGIRTDSLYENTWWGEGEVKIYVDGDTDAPTLVGTGTEDYIGTAYGQGEYSNQYQGSPIVDDERRAYAFYRYHIPDPVYFYEDIKVTIQQIGGAPYEKVQQLIKNGAVLEPISVAHSEGFTKLLDEDPPLNINDPSFPKGWTNFYREDDVSATAYFYLNSPVSNLPAIADVKDRIADLPSTK